MKKCGLKIVLALLLVLISVVALSSCAVKNGPGDNGSDSSETKRVTEGLTFELFDRTETESAYRVTGYPGNETKIVIPEEYEGVPVKAIAESAFKDNDTITKVTIPASVTNVNSSAFENCTALTDVIFEENGPWLYIENRAFDGCTKLSNVKFPSHLVKIMSEAFAGCTSLETVKFPDSLLSLSKNAFDGCPCVKTEDQVSYVDTFLISCDLSVSTLTVRDGTKGIAEHAFYEYDIYGTYRIDQDSELSRVTLPDGLAVIGAGAFCNCKLLHNISIPASVKFIGLGAFSKTNLLSAYFEETEGWTYGAGSPSFYEDTARPLSDLADVGIAAERLVRGRTEVLPTPIEWSHGYHYQGETLVTD